MYIVCHYFLYFFKDHMVKIAKNQQDIIVNGFLCIYQNKLIEHYFLYKQDFIFQHKLVIRIDNKKMVNWFGV
jgi:hypothetical protein